MRNIPVIACFLLMLPAMARAETLVLKSGKTIAGNILYEDSEFVQIEYNGAPLYFERKAIKRIDKDGAAAGSSVPSAAAPEVARTETANACLNADACLQKGLAVYASSRQPGSEGSARAKKYFQQGLACEPENRDLHGVMAILDDMDKGAISEEYAALILSSSYYLMKNEYQNGISSLEKALVIARKLFERTDDREKIKDIESIIASSF